MRGIAYIRHIHGITTEDMGATLGVTKSTVAKWESGHLKISQKQIHNISDIFGVPMELIDKELTETEKLQLAGIFQSRKVQQSIIEISFESNNYEQEMESNYELMEKLLNCDNHMSIRNSLNKILQHPQGREVLHVILASADRYLGIYETKYQATIGKTDYKRGIIRKDDVLVNLIASALELSGIKKEP